MSGLEVQQPGAQITERVESALREAIPGADVAVRGMGGHFEIRVVSEAFAGRNRLSRQRMVLGAIAPLMTGAAAPVHAVDRVETLTPEELGEEAGKGA